MGGGNNEVAFTFVTYLSSHNSSPTSKLQPVFFILIYLLILVSPICLVCCVGAECTETGRARADFAA